MEQQTPEKKILIVDDDRLVRESLTQFLQQWFKVVTAENGVRALELFEVEAPDIVLLDVMMPEMDGIDTLEELKQRKKELPVIMLTACSTVRMAVKAMKLGAADYLSKPFDIESLVVLIEGTLQNGSSEIHSSKRELENRLVGASSVMQKLFERVRLVAEREATVLITGESGTGKELIAQRIHLLSERNAKPFVPINCAAIPETLFEAQLFGHTKGSFTGAVSDHTGFIEQANGGTIFLDEIGELALPVQVKLLRFLQEKEFYPVGSSVAKKADVRIVTATNQSLEELVKAKQFREDLYFRVNVVQLEAPSLRERQEDIPLLVEHFVEKHRSAYGGRSLSFNGEALAKMGAHIWPGNVRELENTVERLMALCKQDVVGVGDLPFS